MNNYAQSPQDWLWGAAAQFLNVGGAVILLPAIVRYMSAEDVGLWLVFTTLVSLAQLVDMGFQPTIARNVAYLYGGATSLVADGLVVSNSADTQPDGDLLATLFSTTKWIYARIAAAMFAILLFGGTAYIVLIVTPAQSLTSCIIAWLLFSLAAVVNGYYGHLNGVLSGRGDLILANKVVVYSRALQVSASIGALIFGLGLVGLGCAAVLSTIVGRTLALRYVNNRAHVKVSLHRVSKTQRMNMVMALWPTASQFGLVMIGVFLVWRANTLVASSTLGLEEAASYGLAIQLFFVLNSFATLPMTLSLPRLCARRARGDMLNVLDDFSVQLTLSLTLHLIGATAIVILGPWFLSVIGSETMLPSTNLLVVMAVIFFLEVNHGTCANFIATGNQVPFVRSALISGALIVFGGVTFSANFGIVALIVSQGLVQLLYNNWKWPIEVSRTFGMSYHLIMSKGFSGLWSQLSQSRK